MPADLEELLMAQAHATTDHQQIKHWVEQRGGHPAVVGSTGEHGLLRIDFEPADDSLKPIDWDTFFDTFDGKSLAFLYQDKTSEGQLSRFNKFVDRNSAEVADLAEGDEDEESSNSNGKSRTSTKSKSAGSRGNQGSTRTSGSSRSAATNFGSAADSPEIDVNDPDEVEEEIEDQLDDDDEE
jgi:hypothetical protein